MGGHWAHWAHPLLLMRFPSRFLLSPLFWCLLAFGLRFFYLIEQGNESVLFYQPTLDELESMRSAEKLLAGEGFGQEPYFKAPYYSLFVSICMRLAGSGWFWMVRFLQHLGGVLLVAMAFDVTKRLSPGPEHVKSLAAAVTAGILTFYAPLIRLENRLVLDFTVVLFQSAMIWALVRESSEDRKAWTWKWLLVAGVFAGLSWLTRPTITPVLPFLAGYVALFCVKGKEGPLLRQGLVRGGCFLVLPLVLMLMVTVRNQVVGGEAMLLPWQGGYNLYHANREEANGRYYLQGGYSAASSGNPTKDLMVLGYLESLPADAIASEALAGEVNAYWMGKTKAAVFEAPAAWLGKMVQKGLYLTSQREIFNFEAFEIHRAESSLLKWLPVGFGWIWPLALTGIVFTCRGGEPRLRYATRLVWGYGLLMGGAIALAYTSGRMRMPLVFPVVILAGIGVGQWILLLRHPEQGAQRKKRVLALPLLLLGVLMSWADWWGVRSEQVAHYDFVRLSDAAWQQGRGEHALRYAEEAEALEPTYPSIPLLKAQALYLIGACAGGGRSLSIVVDAFTGRSNSFL